MPVALEQFVKQLADSGVIAPGKLENFFPPNDSTAVSDLSPLVSDLSPLKGMALKEITFSPKQIAKGIELIRAMNSLQGIGITWDQIRPAAEFWRKYDAGEFGKPDSNAGSQGDEPSSTAR
jgi:hypothetical protein